MDPYSQGNNPYPPPSYPPQQSPLPPPDSTSTYQPNYGGPQPYFATPQPNPSYQPYPQTSYYPPQPYPSTPQQYPPQQYAPQQPYPYTSSPVQYPLQQYPPQQYPPQQYPPQQPYSNAPVQYPQQSSYPPTSSYPSPNYPTSTYVPKRKALLIGINYYGTPSQLKGCINDVNNIKRFITQRYGFTETPDTMMILTDDTKDPKKMPTKANIVSAMRWLVYGAAPGDCLFLHFSGHGSQQRDTDGDEDDGFDETILPVDYRTAGQLVDDEMHDILVKPLPPGVRLTVIFDSCHSGTALDLPYSYTADGLIDYHSGGSSNITTADLMGIGISLLVGDSKKLAKKLKKQKKHKKNKYSVNDQYSTVQNSTKIARAHVVMLSGCRDDQCSVDVTMKGYGATGATSYAFVEALTRNPTPSYKQLLTDMRSILRAKGYAQITQLSTGYPIDLNTPFTL